MIKNWFFISFITLSIFVILDLSWLFFVAKNLYQAHIAHLVSSSIKIVPTILFYILYVSGLMFFVVLPALEQGFSLFKIFWIGAFFGLVTYGTYDLVNHAALKDWPIVITVTDMAWGGLVSGFVSCFSRLLISFFAR